jgi:glycerol uptake facilitator-like aquaporin
VTIMMLFGKKINIQDAMFYIIAQVIGGLCVLGFVKHLK